MTYLALDGYSIFVTILNIAAWIAIAAVVVYFIGRYRSSRKQD